jgi:hypothetical protein
MNLSDKAASRIGTIDGLDRVCMSPDQRRLAQASLRQAELLADMLLRANDDLRKVFRILQRGIGILARRSKVSPFASESRLP